MAPQEQDSEGIVDVDTRADDSRNEVDDNDDNDTKPSVTDSASSTSVLSTPVLAMCACGLVNAYLLISVYPYAGFMVVQLMPTRLTTETAGPAVGLLASVFNVGRGLMGVPWGQLADAYGRTRVLAASMICSGVSTLLFGFSTSFPAALLARFALGLSNAFVGTLKTLASEVAPDDEGQQAQNMSVVLGTWAWGFLFSPSLSGSLAEPLQQYPHYWQHYDQTWVYQLLDKFPFLLPNVAGVLFCIVGWWIALYVVPETLPQPRSLVQDILAAGKKIQQWSQRRNTSNITPNMFHQQPSSSSSTQHQPLPPLDVEDGGSTTTASVTRSTMVAAAMDTEEMIQPTEEDKLLASLCSNQTSSYESTTNISSTQEQVENYNSHNNNAMKIVDEDDTSTAPHPEEEPRVATLTLWDSLCQPATRYPLMLYWCMCFVSFASNEVLPLFCMSRIAGFGWAERDIGQVLSAGGLVFAVSLYFVQTYLYKTLGLRNTIRVAALLVAPTFALMPLARYLPGGGTGITDEGLDDDLSSTSMSWQLLWFLSLLSGYNRLFLLVFMGNVSVAVNQSVKNRQFLAAVNGFSILGGSIAKALGPTFAGVLVSTSVALGGAAWGAWLMFGVLTGLSILVLLLTIVYL